MSRDQKPGKVRHVGVTQDRRAGDAGATVPSASATPASGAASSGVTADAAAPAGKGGVTLFAILIFLMCAGVGGGGIVALAPRLGLWP